MEDEDEPEDEVEDESYSSDGLFGAAETSQISSSVVFVGGSNFVSSVGMLSTWELSRNTCSSSGLTKGNGPNVVEFNVVSWADENSGK